MWVNVFLCLWLSSTAFVKHSKGSEATLPPSRNKPLLGPNDLLQVPPLNSAAGLATMFSKLRLSEVLVLVIYLL